MCAVRPASGSLIGDSGQHHYCCIAFRLRSNRFSAPFGTSYSFFDGDESSPNLIVKELAASGDLVCCRVDGVKNTSDIYMCKYLKYSIELKNILRIDFYVFLFF
ncbi:hypothetical protein CEQ28_021175 [Hafnia alvei]|nr:hypothetical protein CEQ28_021175 [Hafnia alvei]